MALHIPPRVRRIVGATAALLAVLLLAGATYQGVATALDRRQFRRPGGLVDVGGHQLHIYCGGEGSPTVVLEAAAGSMSAAWGWVQPAITRTTRVCSYDRAGLGWSEAGEAGYLPERVPEELRALLNQANEHGPFVIVGHELGADFARLFAARYGAETAAIILIDDPVAGQPVTPGTTSVSAWPWLARAGILRATGGLSTHATGLPAESGGAMRAFLNRPDHLTRSAMEVSRLAEATAAALAAHIDPAIVVTDVVMGRHEQPALLVTAEDGAMVARAIEATVARLREKGASSSPER